MGLHSCQDRVERADRFRDVRALVEHDAFGTIDPSASTVVDVSKDVEMRIRTGVEQRLRLSRFGLTRTTRRPGMSGPVRNFGPRDPLRSGTVARRCSRRVDHELSTSD
jgi:hypothetical protein